MVYRSFEELEVWKRACQLAVMVYQTLQGCNDFGIRDQMQRAAVSIPSNIAEGCERSDKDFARFLRIAQGFGCRDSDTSLHCKKDRPDRRRTLPSNAR